MTSTLRIHFSRVGIAAMMFTADILLFADFAVPAQKLSCFPAPGFAVVKSIPLDGLPKAVLISPDGKSAYVSLLDQNVVAVIDTQTHAIVTRIKVQKFPTAFAISADGKQLFVANSMSNSISVIDAQALNVVKTLDNIPGVISLTLSRNGRLLYGASPRKGTTGILVIDTWSTNPQEQIRRVTDGRERQTNLHGETSENPTSEGHLDRLSNPMAVLMAHNGQRLYVVNPFAKHLTVVDTSTRNILMTIPLNDVAWEIAVTPDDTRLLVTQPKNSAVAVIDANRGRVLDTIAVGKAPLDVGISRDGCWAVVSNSDSSSISVLELPSDRMTTTTVKLLEARPWHVALAPQGQFVYVTNPKGRNILVLEKIR